MKKTWLIIAMAGIACVYAGLCIGGEASVEQGRQLFSDPGLGGSTNQTSCNSCHPDGKGLEKTGSRTNLSEMINACIERALGGKALDPASAEMEALQLYIKSLEK